MPLTRLCASSSLLSFKLLTSIALLALVSCHEEIDKRALREEAYELFMHGYRSYMEHAYPADELMPLSCKGRYRGVTPSRGDVDDSLGNFSLTLIDSLDTLVVLGAVDEFEDAVKRVINEVRFDSDFVVSVFETNIRILGGLLSAHLLVDIMRARYPERLKFYDGQLLRMAREVGDRLMPAFNTTSGLPFSRINLRHGMLEYLKRQKDTCTACGGTMLLEMAALSRLTGNPIYEERARKAMDFLWSQRHRASDLMGTVLNIDSGDWVRREAGIGAGIDSYYEYCLKAYMLLGEEDYLIRFNRHYDAVMRYVNKGPLFVDVHMHRPTVASKGFMDALLAFWPGLQVLKGDVKRAVEMHEMLYQVIQKHKFLPEAFTHDFQVHWGEHPLRPEFIESTYFLYRATKDPHYLQVAKTVMESINKYVRVPCGFAGVKDVRTMTHEDRMDSFVLSETFKYLYLIFTEPEDLLLDPDNFVLTTEAHFLPLSIGDSVSAPSNAATKDGDIENMIRRRVFVRPDELQAMENVFISANPMTTQHETMDVEEAQMIRERTKNVLEELMNIHHKQQQAPGQTCAKPSERLRAWAFSATNKEHMRMLKEMGIDVQLHADGRMHLTHQSINAKNPILAQQGVEFMQEMMALANKMEKEKLEGDLERFVQITSFPSLGNPILLASPSQYGTDLHKASVEAEAVIAEPLTGCEKLKNAGEVLGRIVLIERGDCMFQMKSRFAQLAGAVGVIIYDNNDGTSAVGSASFAMAGDKDLPDDIAIPSLFLYRVEANMILDGMHRMLQKDRSPKIVLRMSPSVFLPEHVFERYLRNAKKMQIKETTCPYSHGVFVQMDDISVTFRFRFQGITQESEPAEHQQIVERHIGNLGDFIDFSSTAHRLTFFNLMRTAAYGALGLNVKDESLDSVADALSDARLHMVPPFIYNAFPGEITEVRCQPLNQMMQCVTIAR